MKKFFFALVFISTLSFSPHLALAADTTPGDYRMLAPIPQLSTGTKVDPETGKTYSVTNISDFLPLVIKLMIGLAIAFALLRIFQGGIMYLSTDAFSGKTEGRKVITDALVGLLLTIGAYTLLYTINPRLVSFRLAIPNNNTAVDSYTGVNGNGLQGDGSDDEVTDAEAVIPGISAGKSWGSDNGIRDELSRRSNRLVSINRLNCKKIGEQSCTSLTGISRTVVDGLVNLATDCKCAISVTGGTEYWLHGNRSTELIGPKPNTTKHNVGGRVIDISIGGPADITIRGKGEKIESGNNCVQFASGRERYKLNGGLYVNEKIQGNYPHWHVCFD